MDLSAPQPEAFDASSGIGTVHLVRPNLPELVCTLVELNDLSCLCLANNPASIRAWGAALSLRENLHARVEFPSELPGFEVDCAIYSLAATDFGLELVLTFPTLSPELCAQLFEAPDQIMDAVPAIEAAVGSVRASMDATVEMERPKDLLIPPAFRPDETIEMERPKNLSAPPPIAAARPEKVRTPTPPPPQPPAKLPTPPPPKLPPEAQARPDATIALERPAKIRTPPPAQPNLDATVALDRPGKIPTPPPPNPDATVALQREEDATPSREFDSKAEPAPPVLVERRAGAGSGLHRPRNPGSSVMTAIAHSKKLGEVLVQMGKLTTEQMDEALQLAQTSGERLGRCLLRWNMIQPDVLCRALSNQTGLPMTVLDGEAMPEKLSKLFPLALMMSCNFVPFDESNAVVCVAACNPIDPEILKEQEKILRKVVEVFLAREDHVLRQLDWLRMKLKTRSRRTIRFGMRLPVSYQFCNRLGVRTDKDVHEGSTVNVSEGGYLLDGPQAGFDPGEVLKKGLYVNVCVKSEAGEIWAICNVREIRLIDESQPRWLLGVEILDISPECKALLKPLCRRK